MAEEIPAKEQSTSSRSSIISPADVRSILTEDTIAARPAPIEHVKSPIVREDPIPRRSQDQPMIRSNRFSVTFPILPPSKEVSPTRASPIVPLFREEPSQELNLATADSSTFLTAIAAQERRVLEIKEELQRAEANLDRLKLQWAQHEAQKKKSETRKDRKLRPLSTTIPSSSDREDGSFSARLQEIERRKSLLEKSRMSNRTVFSGSRHTRTLSLLTPTNHEANLQRPRGATSPEKIKDDRLPRASTTPDLSKSDKQLPEAPAQSIDKDIILETGKKVANGIKDGLWTFWEDLRQATVGEDLVQIHPPQNLRSQSSTQTLRSLRRGGSKASLRSKDSHSSKASAETSRASTRSPVDRRNSPKRKTNAIPLFDDSGVSLTTENLGSARKHPHPVRSSSKHAKTTSVALSAASSDAWDGWDDSPKVSRSSSATSDSTSRPSPIHTSHNKEHSRDPIPWPAINKLDSPNALRRTASNLMSEWGDGAKIDASKQEDQSTNAT